MRLFLFTLLISILCYNRINYLQIGGILLKNKNISNKHKTFQILQPIVLLVVIIYLTSLYAPLNDLENLYRIATIFSFIFVALQARTFIYDSKRNDKRLRKQKAIELAEKYEKEILPLISTINYVFKSIKMDTDVISKIDKSSISYFNELELNKIANKELILLYNEKLRSNDCQKSYSSFKFMNCKTPIAIATQKNIPFPSKFETNDLNMLKDLREFNIIKSSLLNKLESFSMYFNYDIADEEVVYQSLHQTYRSIVLSLYVTIASINKDPKDKYYTNVIELYNRWNKRYQSKLKEEIDNSSSSEKMVHRGKNI